jgi:hypothetical protein
MSVALGGTTAATTTSVGVVFRGALGGGEPGGTVDAPRRRRNASTTVPTIPCGFQAAMRQMIAP